MLDPIQVGDDATSGYIDEIFGGWSKAQKEHFDDGGIYDQILAAKK